MPITTANPAGVHAPASQYAHAALVTGPGRRLVISGQVGMAPDGHVPKTSGEQMSQALANIATILAAHGMAATNLVKLTVYLLNTGCIAPWRKHRDSFLQGHQTASTLLVVSALADPRFLVEIEAEAAD
ncbi:MAG: RidA family protein [Rubritepida sp.]|nr:RidA family protein [Rubritepida sp.]